MNVINERDWAAKTAMRLHIWQESFAADDPSTRGAAVWQYIADALAELGEMDERFRATSLRALDEEFPFYQERKVLEASARNDPPPVKHADAPSPPEPAADAQTLTERLIQEAEGYKERVIATAQGDADRFRKILVEYIKAPAVTRERMYLETMQQVFSNVSKVLVDSKTNSNLLYLPLDKLIQQTASTGAPSTGSASMAPNVPSGSAASNTSGNTVANPAPTESVPASPPAAPSLRDRIREAR